MLLRFLFFIITTVTIAQVDDSKIAINSTSNGKEEAERYAQLLQEAYKEGQYELHKTYSDSLLLVAQLYDIKDKVVMALNSQAIYYKNRNNREKAINTYHIALEKVNLLPNNQGPKSMILVNMGNLYHNIGAYDKSIKIMDELTHINDTTLGLSKIKMAAISRQADNYYELEKYNTFLDFSQQALTLAKNLKDTISQQITLNNLSDYYVKVKDFENAYNITEKGLQMDTKKNPTKTRAWLLLNNGIANFHLDSLDQSLLKYKASLEIAQEKKFYVIEMSCYEEISKVYEKKGLYQQSFKAQKEYAKLKEFIAKDDQKAAVTDLEKNIKSQENKLSEAQKKISNEIESKKQNILYGSLLVIILAGLLLFYISKKKRLEKENVDLRELYTSLKSETAQINFNKTGSDKTQNANKPYDNSALTEKDRKLHKQRVLQYIKLEKPYLNPNLRLSDVAKKLSLSPSHFSEVLHYGFNENFNNLINFYRVVEAQELMKNPDFSDAKIIAIAFDAGFKSKTTFNRVFKNYTGQTPSEYRKAV